MLHMFVMAIHVCFKCMLQMFHPFEMNVASVLSGCCKSRYECCIHMHVTSVYFKCFQVFHTYACKCFIWMLHIFAMIFKCFLDVFASVSDTCFRCFICLFFLYIATVVSRCFKSRLSVVNRMRVGNGRQRGRRPGWRARRPGWDEPTAGALSREPDTTGARSLCAAASGP
jgi:hypothetical protein